MDLYFEIHTTNGEILESRLFNFDKLTSEFSKIMDSMPEIAQYRAFSVPNEPNIAAIEAINKLFHSLNMPYNQKTHFGVETIHIKTYNNQPVDLKPQDVDHAYIKYTRTPN